MIQMLKPGQTVQTTNTHYTCQVFELLGSGGQGEVYRAEAGGNIYALKWYYPTSATQEQKDALTSIIRYGPPNDKFLWPLELVSAAGIPGFGYIMPLRDKAYKNIVDVMKRRIEPTFYALVTAAFELVDSYFQLHTSGLCYRDISFGNVFFDPKDGHVLICDNDNVTINGQLFDGVLGTPRFMAPEVVRGEAYPSRTTDLFSLAVLLFYMFMVAHPLEGAREVAIHSLDLPAMEKLYGREPIFIYDPHDSSNRPVAGFHDNAIAFWKVYPQFLRDLFTRSFTDGIRDAENGRVQESEWRSALANLRDAIFYCAHCGSENFYDGELIRVNQGSAGACWSCSNELALPPRIRIGKCVVMLNHDSVLYPHHIDASKPYHFEKPAAEVTRHPQNPQLWGLKNLSDKKWVAALKNGEIKEFEPQKSVSIAVGTKINFGSREGEIIF